MGGRFFARRALLAILWIVACVAPCAITQVSPGAVAPLGANTVPEADRIQPEELNRILASQAAGEKPVILQVGFRIMFAQAHIAGAQFVGPDSKAAGIQVLEAAVASLPKDRLIVLYCGCCPWTRCPNVGPAYRRMRELGFTRVKVLYLASNFGDDWVSKGYPTARGE